MGKKNFNVKGFLIMLGIVMAISLVPTVIQVIVQYAKEVEFGTSGLFKEEEVKELSEEVIDLFTAKSYKEVINISYFIYRSSHKFWVCTGLFVCARALILLF